jgi:hypothetical protein
VCRQRARLHQEDSAKDLGGAGRQEDRRSIGCAATQDIRPTGHGRFLAGRAAPGIDFAVRAWLPIDPVASGNRCVVGRVAWAHGGEKCCSRQVLRIISSTQLNNASPLPRRDVPECEGWAKAMKAVQIADATAVSVEIEVITSPLQPAEAISRSTGPTHCRSAWKRILPIDRVGGFHPSSASKGPARAASRPSSLPSPMRWKMPSACRCNHRVANHAPAIEGNSARDDNETIS